jgi:hypothetical protein
VVVGDRSLLAWKGVVVEEELRRWREVGEVVPREGQLSLVGQWLVKVGEAVGSYLVLEVEGVRYLLAGEELDEHWRVEVEEPLNLVRSAF